MCGIYSKANDGPNQKAGRAHPYGEPKTMQRIATPRSRENIEVVSCAAEAVCRNTGGPLGFLSTMYSGGL